MIFPEVQIYQPDSFEDFRGELYTLFKQEESDLVFNHDKVSISRKHVLRGMHGDSKSWKHISCLAGEVLVVVDPSLYRPAEVNTLHGDSSKARLELDWKPKTTFSELVKKMVITDIQNESYIQ